jgi:formylglycine-generating enzyme required for sulfatase activity
MHGNVWEMCADVYGKDYYTKSPREDPQGPTEGPVSQGPLGTSAYQFRVMRGALHNEGHVCRSARRAGGWQEDRDRSTGFRVVLVMTSR